MRNSSVPLPKKISEHQVIAQRSFVTVEAETTNAQTAVLRQLELIRMEAGQNLDPFRKVQMAQFLTPLLIARFMTSLFKFDNHHVRLLDPGAGVGTLFASCIVELCSRPHPPAQISVIAYEMDQSLIPYLWQTVTLCRELCRKKGVVFEAEIVEADFIEHIAHKLTPNLFAPVFLHQQSSYNCVILNPPYQKIGTSSATRKYLRQVGIEATNLYAGFLALSTIVLEEGGEMVALTPRSFCNGPYFKAFRRFFLLSHKMTFTRLHLFESRRQLFEEDAVLQENLIFHAVKADNLSAPTQVLVSAGDRSGTRNSLHALTYDQVVNPDDPQCFIHVISSPSAGQTAQKLKGLTTSLEDLGLEVSTGRVVEFRAREFLTHSPLPKVESVPLLHPTHLKDGFTSWPDLANNNGKKRPLFIAVTDQTHDLLVPNEFYVLVKRFTTKEERRRVVAAVHDPASLPEGVETVGFENHLNYFHQKGRGLPCNLAFGLAAFLNSTLLDDYFRQFNGHTQVNATDLRNIRYPTSSQLEVLGCQIVEEHKGGEGLPDQVRLNELVEAIIDTEARLTQ